MKVIVCRGRDIDFPRRGQERWEASALASRLSQEALRWLVRERGWRVDSVLSTSSTADDPAPLFEVDGVYYLREGYERYLPPVLPKAESSCMDDLPFPSLKSYTCRTHPDIVACVEALGNRASVCEAIPPRLKVVTIPDGAPFLIYRCPCCACGWERVIYYHQGGLRIVGEGEDE